MLSKLMGMFIKELRQNVILEYNKKIGGVPWSMHLTCGAADIVKVGYTPSQVADMLEAHPLADKLGIGRYNTFTHVDIRGWLGREAPARW